jgi:alanine dehydrogenase
VHPIDSVNLFSRNEELAARLRRSFPVDAVAVEIAQDAVQGSDMVIAATTASTPLIQGNWLEPGTHVSAVGANTRTKRELDDSCFEHARVVADSRDEVLHESGDLRDAVETGRVTSDVVYAELGELAAGLQQGRSSAKEITIFKSVGVALQDAVAAFLFEVAQRSGIGTQLHPYALGHHFVGR